MNQLPQQYQPQQYQTQLLQQIISVVVTLAIMAFIITDVIKAIKEAVRH